MDPRRLRSFLEWIGAVTRPPLTGNEKKRETDRDRQTDSHKLASDTINAITCPVAEKQHLAGEHKSTENKTSRKQHTLTKNILLYWANE